MPQVDSKSLKKLIFKLASAYEVGKALKQVDIASSAADDGEGTLRIILRVEDLEKANIADLEKLVGAVEDSLSGQDDRFPSVRFAEAA
jgi:hypothetical protein